MLEITVEEDVSLTNWVPFKELKNIQGMDNPGVYLLAHFEGRPAASNVSLSDNIVYIGETTRQALSSRLWQFAQSAFSRKSGHSGGWTYSKLFLGERPIDEAPDDLYVSILSVDREEKESKAYIKYIERLLIWEYFKVQGNYPPCNSA